VSAKSKSEGENRRDEEANSGLEAYPTRKAAGSAGVARARRLPSGVVAILRTDQIDALPKRAIFDREVLPFSEPAATQSVE
jgi:hypothetical protein